MKWIKSVFTEAFLRIVLIVAFHIVYSNGGLTLFELGALTFLVVICGKLSDINDKIRDVF